MKIKNYIAAVSALVLLASGVSFSNYGFETKVISAAETETVSGKTELYLDSKQTDEKTIEVTICAKSGEDVLYDTAGFRFYFDERLNFKSCKNKGHLYATKDNFVQWMYRLGTPEKPDKFVTFVFEIPDDAKNGDEYKFTWAPETEYEFHFKNASADDRNDLPYEFVNSFVVISKTPEKENTNTIESVVSSGKTALYLDSRQTDENTIEVTICAESNEDILYDTASFRFYFDDRLNFKSCKNKGYIYATKDNIVQWMYKLGTPEKADKFVTFVFEIPDDAQNGDEYKFTWAPETKYSFHFKNASVDYHNNLPYDFVNSSCIFEKKFPYSDGNILGDVSGDGKIDITDLSILSLDLVDHKIYTGAKAYRADVTKDGNVNLADLATLKMFISKIIEEF